MELLRILKDVATGALPIQDIPDFIVDQGLLNQAAIACCGLVIVAGVVIGGALIH